MVNTALWVRLEAKAGKEQEPATTAWFALQLNPTTFGIFDAFPDEAGRDAHLAGKVAEALMAKAGELFASPPQIVKVDVLASKLPG
jgi:quinol monooxygenase YgiN